MDAKTQLKEINELADLLDRKEASQAQRAKLQAEYDEGLKKCTGMKLPAAPLQPNAPRKPSKPKHVEADTKIKAEDFVFGYVSLIAKAASKKKIIKEAEETNARLDREYAEKMAQYEKEYAQWQLDLDAYTKAFAQWQKDVKKLQDGNVAKYKANNAHKKEKIKQLEAETAQLEQRIAATTVLSAADRNNSHLVHSVLHKMSTGRADSVMMALNMYDMEERQEAQFRARMQAEAFDRRMESDRRKQWEAQQERELRYHNRQMESFAKETRDYERQQAKDLEEIRKAADKLGK